MGISEYSEQGKMSKETHLDVPQCPKGHGDMVEIKRWALKAKGARSNKETGTTIVLYKCPKCGVPFRDYEKLEG